MNLYGQVYGMVIFSNLNLESREKIQERFGDHLKSAMLPLLQKQIQPQAAIINATQIMVLPTFDFDLKHAHVYQYAASA